MIVLMRHSFTLPSLALCLSVRVGRPELQGVRRPRSGPQAAREEPGDAAAARQAPRHVRPPVANQPHSLPFKLRREIKVAKAD